MKRTIFFSLIALAITACNSSKNEYDATGAFDADDVTISAETAGKLVSLSISEGDTLIANSQVGLIDTVALSLQRLLLEKNIGTVRTAMPEVKVQLAALNTQLNHQLSEKARIEKLLQGGASTQKQLDDINSAIKVLRDQISATNSTLGNTVSNVNAQSSAINIQIAQVDNQLEKCHITTPINGTVLAKYAEEGEFATVGRPLFLIADMQHVYLKAYVTSEQLINIKLGSKVTVFADYGAGKTKEFAGSVNWISNKSEFTPKNIVTSDDRANLVYAIKVAVVNDGSLKIGMYGGVRF